MKKCIIIFLFFFQSEELARQKALRAEMIQLEDVLGQLRKEYEMLRIEFEQNLAANEQTGPINREMRHLITSLQNHNQQLKGEVHRYKRKYKDTSQELNKVFIIFNYIWKSFDCLITNETVIIVIMLKSIL